MNDPDFRAVSLDDIDGLTALFVTCFTGPPWNEPWTIESARNRLLLMANAPSFRGIVVTVENAGTEAESFYLKRNFRKSARKVLLNATIEPESGS